MSPDRPFGHLPKQALGYTTAAKLSIAAKSEQWRRQIDNW